jgi:ParB/RepB/Spo0J family partition protein
MTEHTALEIDINLILPNPRQPRTEFEPDGITDLATTIKEHGIIQPLIVSNGQADGSYTLIAGERRLQAAKQAGLETVPVIMRSGGSEQELLELALIENVQRADLSPVEAAEAYHQLHSEFGLSHEEIAGKVGKSRSAVANAIRLLNLSEEIKEKVHGGEISPRLGEAALTVEQLPEKIKDAAEDSHNERFHPSQILQDIQAGNLTSDEARQRTQNILLHFTSPMTDAIFPVDHEFERKPGIVASQCESCPARQLVGNAYRCSDRDCWTMKTGLWQFQALEKANSESGIPMLELAEDENIHMATTSFYDPDITLGEEGIFAQGCPREQMRLVYDTQPIVSEAVDLEAHPNVSIVCHHGNDGYCQCERERNQATATGKEEKAVEDPQVDHSAQIRQENLQKMENEIVEPAARALADAFAGNSPGAWLLVYRKVAKTGGSDTWDLADIQIRLARKIVEDALPYVEPEYHLDMSRNRVTDKVLSLIGAEAILSRDDDPVEELLERYTKIEGWVDLLSVEVPAPDAVQGNIVNLETIAYETENSSPYHPDDERIDEILQGIAGDVDTLRAILPIVEREQPIDLEQVHSLLTLEIEDGYLELAIPSASRQVIEYALALLSDDEEQRDFILRKALEAVAG